MNSIYLIRRIAPFLFSLPLLGTPEPLLEAPPAAEIPASGGMVVVARPGYLDNSTSTFIRFLSSEEPIGQQRITANPRPLVRNTTFLQSPAIEEPVAPDETLPPGGIAVPVLSSRYRVARYIQPSSLEEAAPPAVGLPEGGIAIPATSSARYRTHEFIGSSILDQSLPEGVAILLDQGYGYKQHRWINPTVPPADVVPEDLPEGQIRILRGLYPPPGKTYRSTLQTPEDVVAEELPEGKRSATAQVRKYDRGVIVINGVFLGDDEPLPQGQIRVLRGIYPKVKPSQVIRPQVPEAEALPAGQQRIRRGIYPPPGKTYKWTLPTPEIIVETPTPGIPRVILAKYPYRAHRFVDTGVPLPESLPEGSRIVLKGTYPRPGKTFIQQRSSEVFPLPAGQQRVLRGTYPPPGKTYKWTLPTPEAFPLPEGQHSITLGTYPTNYADRLRINALAIIAAVVIPPDTVGLEYTANANRLHYVSALNRLHYKVKPNDG